MALEMETTPSWKRIRRNLSFLRRDGCNLSEMEKYFGYENTHSHIRNISLEYEENNLFKFSLTIVSTKRENDILDIYIKELPREMNSVISEYLITKRVIKCSIEIPLQYPFKEPIFKVVEYSENGKAKPYNHYEPSTLYCSGDHCCSMMIEKDVLNYLSKLPWLT